MKKKHLWGVLVLLCYGRAANAQQNTDKQHFVIKGQLGHIIEPAKVYIVYSNGGIRSDSAVVVNNQFTLQGEAGMQQRVNLFLRQNGEPARSSNTRDQLAIYLENGIIEINSPDSLKHAKLGGTQLNRDLQDYINSIGNIKDLQSQIIARYQSEKDTAAKATLMEDYKQLDVLYQTSMSGFVQSHPASLVAIHVLRTNLNPTDNVEFAASLFNTLSDSVKNTPSGVAYKEAIENVYKLAVGKTAPDFAAKDAQGTEKHLSDFKGKYVLLDFWASWCGPCRRESPNLVKNYSKFQNRNFEIISLSVDENPEEWIKAVDADKYTWTNLKDSRIESESVAKLYGITALPTNLLLDPTGKIVAMNIRGEELEKQLSVILN